MSVSAIVENVTGSAIAQRFLAATETRHRVEASLMVKTVSLLTETDELYNRIRNQIDTDIVSEETSWSKAFSMLLASLGGMMREHVDESKVIHRKLNAVYMNHVDYLVHGLSAQLQFCDSLTAEVRGILMTDNPWSVTAMEFSRLQLLNETLQYLNVMLDRLDRTLEKEAMRSPDGWHYFPITLLTGKCALVYAGVKGSVASQIEMFESLLSRTQNTTANDTSVEDSIFDDIADFREGLSRLALLGFNQCSH